MTTIGTPAVWAAFLCFIAVLLALDLGVIHRRAREVRVREAALWSALWIALALAFNALVWYRFGAARGLEFFTGWVIEKSLSVDNVFVFAVLFGSFAVPAALQHRVLFWGVLGAAVLRGVFIFAGAAAVQRFDWLLYVFGGLLLLTGWRLLRRQDEAAQIRRNPVFRLFRRLVPSVKTYVGQRFWIRRGGRLLATPLLSVLVAVEISDLVFAMDSIPAIFAITTDPFIIFTSNIFAVLGLRALYFLLAGAMRSLGYLHVGLALILMFVGAKMLLAAVLHIPTALSLAVIAVLLGGAVAVSLRRRPAA